MVYISLQLMVHKSFNEERDTVHLLHEHTVRGKGKQHKNVRKSF